MVVFNSTFLLIKLYGFDNIKCLHCVQTHPPKKGAFAIQQLLQQKFLRLYSLQSLRLGAYTDKRL